VFSLPAEEKHRIYDDRVLTWHHPAPIPVVVGGRYVKEKKRKEKKRKEKENKIKKCTSDIRS